MGKFESPDGGSEAPKQSWEVMKADLDKKLGALKTDIGEIEVKLRSTKSDEQRATLERAWNDRLQDFTGHFSAFGMPKEKIPEAVHAIEKTVEPILNAFEKYINKQYPHGEPSLDQERFPECISLHLSRTQELRQIMIGLDGSTTDEEKEELQAELNAEVGLKIAETEFASALYSLKALNEEATVRIRVARESKPPYPALSPEFNLRSTAALMNLHGVVGDIIDLHLNRLDLLKQKGDNAGMKKVQEEMRFILKRFAQKALPVLQAAPEELVQIVENNKYGNYSKLIKRMMQMSAPDHPAHDNDE